MEEYRRLPAGPSNNTDRLDVKFQPIFINIVMELSSLSHEWKSYALALLSKAAYDDDCYKAFSYWEIAEDYRFIDRSDAQVV